MRQGNTMLFLVINEISMEWQISHLQTPYIFNESLMGFLIENQIKCSKYI